MSTVAAVDLGASSGRVVVGRVADGTLHTEEVHRFSNGPVQVLDTLHWDVLGLFREIVTGLRAAGELDSIGVDSWAVDYGLLDGSGSLLGNPVHYRDARTSQVAGELAGRIGAERLYAINGLQFQPFNTIFQLAAETRTGDRLLLIPDLISYWLTGQQGAEYTNATTTGLLDVRSGRWSAELLRSVDVPARLLPELRHPGDHAGTVLEHVGIGPVAVTAVGSHDTASAVVAVPADTDRFAYISCGTWSLVGVELTSPVLTEDSRLANFTNEGGVDGTVRYLRNVMGLWLLQECMRSWREAGEAVDLDWLLRDAARASAPGPVFDPNDPVFLPPGDMPARIRSWCRSSGQPEPVGKGDLVRSVLDSLALAHRTAIADAQRLSGKEVEVVHVVGGGARNELLCQLTADACGIPVIAGPSEATALGNVLVQARATGSVHGTLADMRALVRSSQPLRRHLPRRNGRGWAAAAALVSSQC